MTALLAPTGRSKSPATAQKPRRSAAPSLRPNKSSRFRRTSIAPLTDDSEITQHRNPTRKSDTLLDQNIDTSDATGRLLFNMLGAIGQFETQIRAERQMDGIKKAKDRGVQFGKRPALSEDQISELCEKRGQGILIKDLMAHYDLSKATIYRYLGTKDT